MRTSREACPGWGAVELSFLGATLQSIDTRALNLQGHPDAAVGGPALGRPCVERQPAGPAAKPSGSYCASGGELRQA